jgi:hypothetical protein
MELAMEALEGDADPLPGRPRIGYQPLEGHPTHLALGPEGAPSGDAQKGMLAQPRDAPQQPAGIQTLSGQPLEARYIVLQGQLRVSMALEESLELAQIQAGGISFVDSRPPTATVTASTDALVLAIFRQRLTAKLAQDEGFVARCYHALAVVLADRIRSTVLRLASRSRDRLADARDVEEELDPRSCSAWPWPEPALTECGSGYRVPHG